MNENKPTAALPPARLTGTAPGALLAFSRAPLAWQRPDQVRRSVVSGAVPAWVSPRTLVPDGTALMRTAL
jgi:hypothetical protein